MKGLRIGTRTSRLARAQTGIVIEMLRTKFSALKIEVVPVTTGNGGLPLVSGDRGQLVQLLAQLLDNAARFRGAAAPVVSVSAEAMGGAVRVTVADNGPGVSETDLPRLFTAFARARPLAASASSGPSGGRGAGLGLALCRRIVERHGGMIWAERGADGGLVVRFDLAEG